MTTNNLFTFHKDQIPINIQFRNSDEFVHQSNAVATLRGSGNFIEEGKFIRSLSTNYTIPHTRLFEFNELKENLINNPSSGGKMLCRAAFRMDADKLIYLLNELHVPIDSRFLEEGNKTALHCLATTYILTDARARSQIYAHLNGKHTWVNDLFDPPLQIFQPTILAQDIIDSLSTVINRIAKILIYAGITISAQDISGNTALHLASIGGHLQLSKILLSNKVDYSIENNERRTALHYAVGWGHAQIAQALVENGANLYGKDENDVQPIDMIMNPGPIRASDAMKYFNIEQRPVRKIERIIHPENYANDKIVNNKTYFDSLNKHEQFIEMHKGWRAGDGGWGSERLKEYENDMTCDDVDQYWADEITGKEIFRKYLARNSPVLIRGLIHDWPIVDHFQMDTLSREHGDTRVPVTTIPYSETFNAPPAKIKRLADYLNETRHHRIYGGKYPWYIFRSHMIPQGSEADDSMVPYKYCHNPPAFTEAFKNFIPLNERPYADIQGMRERNMFCNAQLAIGGEATGAALHYHYTAWGALVYGAKKWFLYPPHDMIMSSSHILDFMDKDLERLQHANSVSPLTCIQTAGDVMIVPEQWGHGVLNLQESIAIATESKRSLFRAKPESILMQFDPPFVKWGGFQRLN
eukprot:gene9381-12640_t